MEKKVRLACLNMRSVNNKIEDMRDLVQDYTIDVLTLCETWHKDVDCAIIKRLVSLRFNVLETAKPIDSKKSDSVNFVNHGRVTVIARHGFIIAKIDLKTKVVTFEYLAVHIASKGASSIVVIVYRPGSVRPDKHFFSYFTKFLGAVAAFSMLITIVGDINICQDLPDDVDTVVLLDLIASYVCLSSLHRELIIWVVTRCHDYIE